MADSIDRRIRVKRAGLGTTKGMVMLGQNMSAQGPSSGLWISVPAVASAGSDFVAKAALLAGSTSKVDLLTSQLRQARGDVRKAKKAAKAALELTFAAVEANAKDGGDLHGMSLEERVTASHKVETPAFVRAVLDKLTGNVELGVEGADGIETIKYEHSPEPIVAGSISQVPGIGRTRKVEDLAAGRHWFRAQSTRGGVDSGFTEWVSAIVR